MCDPVHDDVCPAGLALSTELRRRGIEALTIDKIAEGANTSRAAVVHARTLEVLEPLGVVPTMLAEGVKVPIFRIRDRVRALLTVEFKDIPSRFPFTLMCPQNRTEAILLERLMALGGGVIRPAEATALRTGHERAEVAFPTGMRLSRGAAPAPVCSALGASDSNAVTIASAKMVTTRVVRMTHASDSFKEVGPHRVQAIRQQFEWRIQGFVRRVQLECLERIVTAAIAAIFLDYLRSVAA